MDEERAAYHQMLASVEELCRKGALAVGDAASVLFVDGMANLIAAEVDRERLRQMLLALEAKQRLVELLTAYVDGSQQEVRVVVGLDEASPAMQDLVLIGVAGAAGRRQPGNGGGDCADPHPIPGDDPGGALYCEALGAHPGDSDPVECPNNERDWCGCESASNGILRREGPQQSGGTCRGIYH